nr:immunoglobulin heavy chain junction region [Mus musculus]
YCARQGAYDYDYYAMDY